MSLRLFSPAPRTSMLPTEPNTPAVSVALHFGDMNGMGIACHVGWAHGVCCQGLAV